MQPKEKEFKTEITREHATWLRKESFLDSAGRRVGKSERGRKTVGVLRLPAAGRLGMTDLGWGGAQRTDCGRAKPARHGGRAAGRPLLHNQVIGRQQGFLLQQQGSRGVPIHWLQAEFIPWGP